MKKLLYGLTGLCLLAGVFAGCEKKPLDDDNPNGGGSTHKGTIEGIVTDKATDKPILLASVTLQSTTALTMTDTAGHFTLNNIEPGTYKLQVKRNGYSTHTSEELKVEGGKTVRYNAVLESLAADLQILNIHGEVIEELIIDDNSTNGVFILKNAGKEIVEWEIPKLATEWITGFSKQSGKLAPGAADTVELSIELSKLSNGGNEATLYIGSSIGDKQLLIKAGVERSFCFTDASGEELQEVVLSDVAQQYPFKIKNTGKDVLTWRLTAVDWAEWLQWWGKTEGTLAVGESESLTLRIIRELGEGSYETRINLSSNAGEKTLPVKITVAMACQLEDENGNEISELEFGAASSKTFKIKNTSTGKLTWELLSANAAWLTFGDTKSGSVQPGAAATITMTIDRSLLSEGDNRATVNISTNAGDKQLDVNAHVEMSYQFVNAQGAEISELDLDRTPQGLFKIKNTGTGVLRWEISPISVDWLGVDDVTQGQIQPNDEATIVLSVDQSKASDGTNEATLNIGCTGGNKQLPVSYLKYIGEVGSDYVETVSDIEFQMVAVQGGVFMMGATEEQGNDATDYEKPVHQVLLDGFYIGKYEVTVAQWKAVMGNTSSLNLNHGDNYPAISTCFEIIQFCQKLSQMTGKKYRLPTEAEWEYAARGGNESKHYKYAGSNDIDEVAWYGMTYPATTPHPVGTKKANELGIYDMSGNVMEWCSTRAEWYDSSPAVNPKGPSSGTNRMIRGGSWTSKDVDCRVSKRIADNPDGKFYNTGFRIVLEP